MNNTQPLVKRSDRETKKRNICGGPLRSPIDPSDDVLMIRFELRPPVLRINRNVFRKTQEEKYLLRMAKFKRKFEPRTILKKKNEPTKVLTVYVKNKKGLADFRTTARYTCTESEVSGIINTFHDQDEIRTVVR